MAELIHRAWDRDLPIPFEIRDVTARTSMLSYGLTAVSRYLCRFRSSDELRNRASLRSFKSEGGSPSSGKGYEGRSILWFFANSETKLAGVPTLSLWLKPKE